jgi:HPt (histidine-containing phosphotransfer) domain-containing protein
MEAQDVIDPAAFNELRDQVGADFVIELIDTYCLETQELIEKLRPALAAQDAVTFGRLAHSIKSSSASLGALAFSQQARELEMLGKASDLTGAEPKLKKLEAAFLQVVNCLEELKNAP